MLVLSRKISESIIIAGNIRVMIVEIRGDRVRIGVEAPKETPVHREEVWLEIQRTLPGSTGS